MRILNLQYKKITPDESNGIYVHNPVLEKSTRPPERFGTTTIDVWENLVVNPENDWGLIGGTVEAFKGLTGVLEYIRKLDNEHDFSHVLVPEAWPQNHRSDLKVILGKRGIGVITPREFEELRTKKLDTTRAFIELLNTSRTNTDEGMVQALKEAAKELKTTDYKKGKK